MGRLPPFATGSYRPRLCKNVFERVRYSKPDWKSRFYAKSTSADVPINFRFNVDAHTLILAKCFYTLWAKRSQSDASRKSGAIQRSLRHFNLNSLTMLNGE
jgi:hypothetical protein